MRNLKKILALVLALMMVLSVMVTASAADFTDADTVDHAEAVDVMVAAGVLNGKPAADGTYYFDPTGTIDRASSAKLMAYLKLGELVDLIDQTETTFPDVAKGNWASGYIAYCADNDIVVGSTNGNFNPTANVDGYSFAKMLLMAIGAGDLDDTAEYNILTGEWKVAPYTGNSWTLKVRLAIATLKNDYNIDVLAGLSDVSLKDNLSREHAAQMVFNVLNDTGILEDTYGLTKSTYDVAGLTYSKWIYTDPVTKETTDITEAVLEDTYVETFGAGTTYADIAAALGVTEKSDATYATRYWNTVNPDEVDLVEVYVGNKDSKITLARTVDVYVTATGTYKLMHTTESLVTAKLGAQDTDKTSKTYGLYAWEFGSATTYAAKDAYTDKSAYLVVIGDGKLVAEPKLAETVQGKITSKGSDYVRMAGSTTKYTFKYTAQIPATLGDEKVLYLATDGTVLSISNPADAPIVETTETLVYVLGFYSVYVPAVKGTDPVYNQYGELIKEGTEGTDAYYKRMAQCVTLDGEVVDYLFRIDPQASAWVTGNNGMKLRAVTVDSKTGIATFSDPESAVAADAISVSAVKITDGTTNYYYNAAEYVNIIGTKSSVSVVEGTLKGAVAANTTAWAVYTGEGTNKTISKVFYWTAPSGEPVADPDTYYDMFIVGDATSTDSGLIDTVDADGKATTTEVYYHTVYLSGTKTEIMTYGASLTAGVKSYQVDKYGVYVEIKDMANTVSGTVDNLYGTLATIGEFVDYDIAEVTVIDLSAKGNGTVDAGDTVTVVYNVDKTTSAKTIVVIYITASVEAK